MDPKGTGSSNPSIKRKLLSKGDRPPKKPKAPLEPIVGLMAEGVKTITLVKHETGKGFMKALSTNQEKRLQTCLGANFVHHDVGGL